MHRSGSVTKLGPPVERIATRKNRARIAESLARKNFVYPLGRLGERKHWRAETDNRFGPGQRAGVSGPLQILAQALGSVSIERLMRISVAGHLMACGDDFSQQLRILAGDGTDGEKGRTSTETSKEGQIPSGHLGHPLGQALAAGHAVSVVFQVDAQKQCWFWCSLSRQGCHWVSPLCLVTARALKPKQIADHGDVTRSHIDRRPRARYKATRSKGQTNAMVQHVSVVIPSFRVRKHILGVLARIGPEVSSIYVVDDRCPEDSGTFVESSCTDPRVRVLRNATNLGVGGAVMAGYRAAYEDGAQVIVKVDGDGQMAPELIPQLIAPLLAGEADYTKGNRFFNVEDVRAMPGIRLLGNAGLSFMTKFSTGFWHIFDPTNGFTALHASLVPLLPLSKINNRYFFETDMLFRLEGLRAKVIDIPMRAVYGDEESGLRISRVLPEFFVRHIVTGFKRIFYDYFLRDFSVATIELVVGSALLVFGVVFGATEWVRHVQQGQLASAGTVMLAVLPITLGIQLLLAFLSFDIARTPTEPLHKRLARFADPALKKTPAQALPPSTQDALVLAESRRTEAAKVS